MSKASVLIVEDEKVLQDVYRFLLASEGYTVYTGNNGQEGIMALKKYRPDLVLLDIFMPVMDGREFLRNIERDEYPDTKIVVYSNISDRQTEEEMLSYGADKFILKSSLSPRQLLELVDGMLRA